jgi:hypothetical protein
LELADLSTLLMTNKKKKILLTVDRDVMCKQFAKCELPLLLLDISVYKNSCKELLQDHNSKNGICQLQLITVSFSRRNTNQLFCVSMIQHIAWDRRRNHVIFEGEAFGEDDLTEALGTTINRGTQQKLRPWCMNHENNGPSHKLCRLGLPVELFSPDCKHAHSCPCPTALFSRCPSYLHWDCHVICKNNQRAGVLPSFCHLEVPQFHLLGDTASLFHGGHSHSPQMF